MKAIIRDKLVNSLIFKEQIKGVVKADNKMFIKKDASILDKLEEFWVIIGKQLKRLYLKLV